jgi:hypothetical protein
MNASRLSDEMTLEWLRLRDGGLTSFQIAERFGVTPERVRVATSRVVKDDRATGDDTAGYYHWFGDRAVRAAE